MQVHYIHLKLNSPYPLLNVSVFAIRMQIQLLSRREGWGSLKYQSQGKVFIAFSYLITVRHEIYIACILFLYNQHII